jgi:anti-sigma B factor antagonist
MADETSTSSPHPVDEDDRRAALRALQGLSLEEAVELLLELGVLDPVALADRRDAQEREWRGTSAEVLGDELEAVRRQARQQRRKAEALRDQSQAQRHAAIAAREQVVRIDERRREIAGRRRAHTAASALDATHRALAAALAAARILGDVEDAAPPPLDPPEPAPPAAGEGPGLDVHVEQTSGAHVIAASGEVDMGTAGRLQAALADAVASGATDIWVDLTDVSFMDSTGVSALLAARRALPAACRLVVVTPPGPCRRLLELTGVAGILSVVGDRAAAAAI